MVKTVAVDFDKVVHSYERGWQDGAIYGDLIPGSAEALHDLMQEFAVFIHTTRKPKPVAIWIEENAHVPCVLHVRPLEFWNSQGVILVTNQKLPAIAYIDDRAIRFENWSQALSDLKTYNEGRRS